MSGKKKPKCPECDNTTYVVSWRKTYQDILVGYYCRHCKLLYPKKGINPGKNTLYLGLREVSN